MSKVTYFSGESFPLEMHKVRIIQKLTLLPIEERLRAVEEAGYNTFLLQNKDVFLDMLTDSGVNAMSDRQQAAMLTADDAYAGSETFTRLHAKLSEVFGMKYFLPTHQGRAAEHILARGFVKPGQIVATNYHFTTTKAHITAQGGEVVELIEPSGLSVTSDEPFKGNVDIDALTNLINERGAENIAFFRVETGTNLVGGQPHSLSNLRAVSHICRRHGIPLVMDASLLADNLYFIKTREPECADWSVADIWLAISQLCDIIYFSARKLGFGRGGGIVTDDLKIYESLRAWVPMFEGFLTYGGMSVREMEAITIGLDETLDEDMINQGPLFIAHFVDEMERRGIPVVTPAGGLGAHVDAMRFLDHVDQRQYPSGALAAAVYLASGVRGMERGTLSEQREPDGTEPLAHMELLRLALPRRVFTLSQVQYATDRIHWVYANRRIVGGLEWVEEPEILRFFYGRLRAVGDWQHALVAKFREDFGSSL
ncbi:MAG: tryptophanase [Micrococcales bacterium]|nr:tryptophanase [Micrococcales bacterium]MCL2666687.1 tryptophanase [Micrococcales bacterium]